MTILTYDERERIAYINGDTPLAELLDSAACVDAGWLSPEEADELRKELEAADEATSKAENEADELRSRIDDLESILREGMALAPIDPDEWANWAAQALEVMP